ncbi:hypothetical protein Xaut_1066 [Xanthobacter versatilis]|uniref:Uncharacterized protein n=1 Tax=Xanthobacter autotrophicus (strain ATCC BAA-1158 / Py2) TaxID=78245 RepID=A7IE73_XANP2|nr:hypothetical protein Xaut_1066 [Xanthobacter autotrophicus Py2]
MKTAESRAYAGEGKMGPFLRKAVARLLSLLGAGGVAPAHGAAAGLIAFQAAGPSGPLRPQAAAFADPAELTLPLLANPA